MTVFSTHTSRLSSALQRGSVAAHVRKAAMLTALFAGYGAGFSPALQAQSAVAQTAIAVQASVNINTADAASMAPPGSAQERIRPALPTLGRLRIVSRWRPPSGPLRVPVGALM